jgi:exonuclease SbcD
MTIGQEHMLLPSSLAHPGIDYVALGHIHRHQVVSEELQPVVYSGSLERVDFGDEQDNKGFYQVNIEPGGGTMNRKVSYEFHPVPARRFLTIESKITLENEDPTATVLKEISVFKDEVKDAIVRLNIALPAEKDAFLKDNELRDALKPAHYFLITRDLQREKRTRLGTLTAEGMTPLDALKKWLELQNMSPEHSKLLMEYGERLIQGRSED